MQKDPKTADALPGSTPSAVEASSPASPLRATGSAESASAASSVAEETPSPPPGRLEAGYLASRDSDRRTEIVFQLSDLNTLDALRALGRLFQSESDPQLKADILNAISNIDEQIDSKLAIYALAVRAGQPDEAREAAIDGLEQLNDPRALSTWRTLLSDLNPDIRETAKLEIEKLQALDSP